MKTVILHFALLAGLLTLPARGAPGEPIALQSTARTIHPFAPSFVAPAAPSTNLLAPAALEVVSQHQNETAEVGKEARVKIGVLRTRLALASKELQESYTRAGKLDGAVAVRDYLGTQVDVYPKGRPAPSSLALYNSYVGRVGFFRVAGANPGALWGTDTYTTDSSLAAAAVHSGALKIGEMGLVKVTILPGCASYEGSTRNGITSSSWGSYPASYQVEPVRPEDEKDIQAQSDLPLVPSGSPAPGEWPQTPGAISTAQLPDDALQLVEHFQAESATIQQQAEQKLRHVRREVVAELKPLMTNYAREVKLDEAVAVRDYIRTLSEANSKVLTDPGMLFGLPQAQGTLYFRVTGRSGGIIWGTDFIPPTPA
jgi:hypothetical protein